MPTQVDHIMPRSRGGTDDRSNLAPACTACNMEKLDFTPEEYRAYREKEGLGWPPQSMGDMDNRPQPRYPFEFVQADAMTFPLDGYDAIHAAGV